MEKNLLAPYIKFVGNCEEAMKFYQTVFGGKLDISKFGDAPMESSEEQKDKVVHAVLQTDDFSLFACDTAPANNTVIGTNIDLSISGTDEPTLQKYFDGLSQGGKVDMPLAKQFWGDHFGMLTDQYGIHWMVNIGSNQDTQSDSK